MPATVTLIRHARSEANVANIWQGQGDSALAGVGRAQATELGARLKDRDLGTVVCSDLRRTMETAELAGVEPTRIDPRWREMNLGEWEGRTFAEVAEEHPDLLEALRRGDAVRFGGDGETIPEFEERVFGAFDELMDGLDDDGAAIVFTHGGVIDAVVGRYLGRRPGSRTYPIATNTSMTTIAATPERSRGRPRLTTFNDAAHLGHDVGAASHFRSEPVPIVGLVRHGVTEANMIGRIQGQQCWGLHPDGHDQAERFAAWYGPVDRIYSSPIQRARETAEKLRSPNGITFDDRLMEQHFGEWEGSISTDLPDDDREVLRRIYGQGEDLPRGRNGETFAELTHRLSGFLATAEFDPGERTVVVSHGAAIKALVADVLGPGADVQPNLGVSPNTGVSHVAFTEHGPMLLDYAVAPHLEGL